MCAGNEWLKTERKSKEKSKMMEGEGKTLQGQLRSNWQLEERGFAIHILISQDPTREQIAVNVSMTGRVH